MTTATINLPREEIEAAQHETDVWYADLDEEIEAIVGKRKESENEGD